MQISVWDGRGMLLGPGKWAPQWREMLWWYFIHIIQAKSQFVAKVSASKMYKILLFFSFSSPSPGDPVQRSRSQRGWQWKRWTPTMAPVARCWAFRAAPGTGKKTQQTNRKQKQEVACGRRKGMAIGGLAPMPPEAVERELAGSEAAHVIFGTHFYGRRGNCSLSTSDQWGSLVWVVCGEEGEDYAQFPVSPGCSSEGSRGEPGASVLGQGVEEAVSRNGLTLLLTDPNGKISPMEEAFASGFHNLWNFQNPDVLEDISFSRVFAFNLHLWRIGSIVHGQRQQFPLHCSFEYWR